MERAHFRYLSEPASKEAIENTWNGWKIYIESYCRRSNFRDTWSLVGHTFNEDFQHFMAAAMLSTAKQDQ